MFKHIDIRRNMHTARSLCGVFVSLLIVVLCGMSNMALAEMHFCDKGKYLPKGADKCENCPAVEKLGKLYCPGEKGYPENKWVAQGVEYCAGTISLKYKCSNEGADTTIQEGKFRHLGTKGKEDDCSVSNLRDAYNTIRKVYSGSKFWKNLEFTDITDTTDLRDTPAAKYFYNLQQIVVAQIDRLYCPGGDTGYDMTFPLGIHVCPTGQVATEDRKGCENAPEPSLPTSSNNGNSQSSTTNGDTKNDDTTTEGYLQTAVSLGIDKLSCAKGNVLVGMECVPCSSKPAWVTYANESRMYCPGGEEIKIGTPLTAQLTKCPAGMWPNSELSDCVCGYGLTKHDDTKCSGTLSYYDMYYGPSGEETPLFKQCWTKTTDKAYKKCMGFDN